MDPILALFDPPLPTSSQPHPHAHISERLASCYTSIPTQCASGLLFFFSLRFYSNAFLFITAVFFCVRWPFQSAPCMSGHHGTDGKRKTITTRKAESFGEGLCGRTRPVADVSGSVCLPDDSYRPSLQEERRRPKCLSENTNQIQIALFVFPASC